MSFPSYLVCHPRRGAAPSTELGTLVETPVAKRTEPFELVAADCDTMEATSPTLPMVHADDLKDG